MATGQCRVHTITDPREGPYTTGGLAVTARPYHLVDADGLRHPRRFAFGVPTESVRWVTAAGARPGINSIMLSDADAISQSTLALPPLPTPAHQDPQHRNGFHLPVQSQSTAATSTGATSLQPTLHH